MTQGNVRVEPIILGTQRANAVVSMVYGSGSSFMEALVLGESLKRGGRDYDTILMVADDYSADQSAVLGLFWDYVIRVDSPVSAWTVTKEDGASECSKVFTKCNIFRLVEYSKVLYLDADCHVNTGIKRIFSLATPAAALRSKDYAWVSGLRVDPAVLTKTVLNKEQGSYNEALNLGVMLIKPSLVWYQKFLAQLSGALLHNRTHEDVLIDALRTDWHSLSCEYNFRPAFVSYGSGRAFGANPLEKRCMISHFHGKAKACDMFFFFEDFKVLRDYFNKAKNNLVSKFVSWNGFPDLVEAQSAEEMLMAMHKQWNATFIKVGEKVVAELGPVLFRVWQPQLRYDLESYRERLEEEAERKRQLRSGEAFKITRTTGALGLRAGVSEVNSTANVIRLPANATRQAFSRPPQFSENDRVSANDREN